MTVQLGLPLAPASNPAEEQGPALCYVAHHRVLSPVDQLLAGEAIDTVRDVPFLHATIDEALRKAQAAWCFDGTAVVCRYQVGDVATYDNGEPCTFRRVLHHEALIGAYRLTFDGWRKG